MCKGLRINHIILVKMFKSYRTPTGNTPTGNTPTGNTPTGNTPTGNSPMKHIHMKQPQQAQPDTIAWSTVVSFLEKNPFQEKKLTPYIRAIERIEGDQPDANVSSWTLQPIEPATPLSCILFVQNSDYQNGSLEVRRGLLRDECTSLQEKAGVHLKGRAWPVRRTIEGIVAAAFEEKMSTWSYLGFAALAELHECQILFFNTQKKTITFVPQDVRNWSKDRECVFIQEDARAAWIPPQYWSNKHLGMWLQEKENSEWSIEWPLCDGTLVELKDRAAKNNMVLEGKSTKDVLSKRIGRTESVHLFSQWTE